MKLANTRFLSFFFGVCWLLAVSSSLQAQTVSDRERLEVLSEDLEKPEPAASRALLELSNTPDMTVAGQQIELRRSC